MNPIWLCSMAKIIRSQTGMKKEQKSNDSERIKALFDKKVSSMTNLKRIIKQKRNKIENYGFKIAEFDEFNERGEQKFSEDEKELIRLESEIKRKNEYIAELEKKLVKTEEESFNNGMSVGLKKVLNRVMKRPKKKWTKILKN